MYLQIEPDDGLPQCVCMTCFMNIRATFVYRQLCEQSDAELRHIFQQHLSIASIKSERTDTDQQDIDDPLYETWFDETKSTHMEILPCVDIKIDEINYDTIPVHLSGENKSKQKKNATTKMNLAIRKTMNQTDEMMLKSGATNVVNQIM